MIKDHISLLGSDLLLCQVFLKVRHSLAHFSGRLLLAVMAFPRLGVACLLTGLGTFGKGQVIFLSFSGQGAQFDHANTAVAQEISPLVERWKEVHSHQASKVTSRAESEFVVVVTFITTCGLLNSIVFL